jgi:hypothetical protein
MGSYETQTKHNKILVFYWLENSANTSNIPVYTVRIETVPFQE